MCSRTYITIIVFIICEFVFSRKSLLWSWDGYTEKVVEFHLPTADGRLPEFLYPASATTICRFSLDILSYNALKVRLSCSLPGCTISKIHPCFCHRQFLLHMQKTCLCSPFRNHPLSGSLMLHFCVFTSSGSSSDIESLSFPVPPDAGGWLSSFFFNGFFPMCQTIFFNLFYLIPLLIPESLFVCNPLTHFFTVCTGFYMCCIHEDLFCIYKLIFHTIFQNL